MCLLLTSINDIEYYRKEFEERLKDYENQIENLMYERRTREEIQKNNFSSPSTIDNAKQTDDRLIKINKKLKQTLQMFNDKIHRLVDERSDLFINIGDNTNERLDHLISIVENQTTYMNTIQNEHKQLEEELRNEIRELQK